VKRVDLERHLRAHGCRVMREGGSHTRWGRVDGPQRSSMPRHREIAPGLVRAICKDLDVPQPTNPR
jgi:predicted RNA binding protein YcfA (HicA-like mRNA interferase family)